MITAEEQPSVDLDVRRRGSNHHILEFDSVLRGRPITARIFRGPKGKISHRRVVE